MTSVRTTILTSEKKLSWAPGSPFSCEFYNSCDLKLDQNDVEFDFKIGHVLFFSFL